MEEMVYEMYSVPTALYRPIPSWRVNTMEHNYTAR
jgi:hypothetical protein